MDLTKSIMKMTINQKWVKKHLLFFFILFLTSIQLAHAQKSFTGAIDDKWDEGGNWSPVGVPNSKDAVTIAKDSVSIRNGVAAHALSVVIEGKGNIRINTAGKLTIHESQGNGIDVAGTINCLGRIHIIKPTLKAIVNQDNSIIDIGSLGFIRIDTAGVHGIENSGIINNQGNIDIDSTGNKGIRNLAGSTLENNGTLLVAKSASIGIENFGMINNLDFISINGTMEQGLWNEGTFDNSSGASIEIRETKGDFPAIRNQLTHLIDNEGIIRLRDLSWVGLLNYGNVTNNDSLIIENAVGYGIQSLNPTNTSINFNNFVDGVIKINSIHPIPANLPTSPGGFGTGIFSNHNFFNEGLVDIIGVDGIGLYNLNVFTNTAIVKVSQNTREGIYNQGGLTSEAFFINETGAQISVFDMEGTSASGIVNSFSTSSFLNRGDIYIDNIERVGLDNRGFFLNEDSLNISNTGSSLVVNSGYFINSLSGMALLKNGLGEFASGLSSSGKISNFGKITIDSVSNDGLSSIDTLYNTGDIYIIHTQKAGLVNAGILNNEGSITIDSVNGDIASSAIGLSNSGNGSIVNDGSIAINEIQYYGISNSGNIYNHSNITVSRTQDDAIHNRDSIYNDGGTIIIAELLADKSCLTNLASAFFDNSGTISLDPGIGLFTGVTNFGLLKNSDIISIYNGSEGIKNRGDIQNELGGTIIIQDMTSISGYGIQTILNSELINTGSISISNIEGLGYDGQGFFNNTEGSLLIEECTNTGMKISQTGSFMDGNDATLTIKDAGIKPLEVLLGGVFDVLGLIEVVYSNP